MRVAALTACLVCPPVVAAQPAPPPTVVRNMEETIHGRRIVDPYRWLEDQNSPETRAWIRVQTEYTQTYFGQLPGRDALMARLKALQLADRFYTPYGRNGRYIYLRRSPGQEQSVLYLRHDGQDDVLVNPDTLAPDHSLSVSLNVVSPDCRRI